VPADDYTCPFGEANITRTGSDVTNVAFSRMVLLANKVADKLAKEGISCEVIDPRTTSPLDSDSIIESVEKTGRLVVVDEATPMCGMASEIASIVACEALECLEAPIIKVTAPHTPVPATPELEQDYIPNPDKIERAVRKVLGTRGAVARVAKTG
jgi:pyruvate dehydrogenase E1 component beta subunit